MVVSPTKLIGATALCCGMNAFSWSAASWGRQWRSGVNDRELHCRSKEAEERVKARRATNPDDRAAHRAAADEWQDRADDEEDRASRDDGGLAPA